MWFADTKRRGTAKRVLVGAAVVQHRIRVFCCAAYSRFWPITTSATSSTGLISYQLSEHSGSGLLSRRPAIDLSLPLADGFLQPVTSVRSSACYNSTVPIRNSLRDSYVIRAIEKQRTKGKRRPRLGVADPFLFAWQDTLSFGYKLSNEGQDHPKRVTSYRYGIRRNGALDLEENVGTGTPMKRSKAPLPYSP